MKAQIRAATEDDLPQVLALYAQPELDEGKVLDLAEAQTILKEFTRYPNYRLFVACDAETRQRIWGSYALMVMHNLAHRGAPSAIVEDVVVASACRSQGIGRQMMAHAIEQAREASCYKLALSSNQKRERAHAFYESLGFARHGVSFVIHPEHA